MLTTRLAVWGDPIDHSRSPDLHGAAYRALGLDWDYGRARVDEASFESAVAALGPEWRGLSLTMPLKGIAHRLAARLDRRAELTGAVNTYLLGGDGPTGFNTDVGGLAADLRARGFDGIDRARIVGAGATATSALVSLTELGARSIQVVARRPAAVAPMSALGATLGIEVEAAPLAEQSYEPVPLTVAALPGGAALPAPIAAVLAQGGGALTDVVYGHWPSALGAAFLAAGLPAEDGLGMLLHQALLQVRVFVAGDPGSPLEAEPAVLAAMRAAVGRGTGAGPDMGD